MPEVKEFCPICGKENKNTFGEGDSNWWVEFGHNYHVSCIRKREREGRPFHEKYAPQKRLSQKQVKEVLDLLHDEEFLEYYLNACCTEEEREELYDHPILNEYDLLP